MLEEQPLDLSVRVADFAELSRDGPADDLEREPERGAVKKEADEFGETAALRLRGLNGPEYPDREDRTCSEDSDDSCSDNKDGGPRSRARPPGTKPYKKNLMRRYLDTREVQSHDTGEKEALGLATVKAEPGSTGTSTRLLHGILSQHPQQHALGMQNGYGRHLANHPQLGQPPYNTAAIATTSTTGTKTTISYTTRLPGSPME